MAFGTRGAKSLRVQIWIGTSMQVWSDSMCGLGQAQFSAMVEEGYQASLTWHQGAFNEAQPMLLLEPYQVSCLQAQLMYCSITYKVCFSVSRADLEMSAPNLCYQGRRDRAWQDS